MDRVEPVPPLERTLDAIDADLDALESALATGATGLAEIRVWELPEHLDPPTWTVAERARAADLLERNARLAEQLVGRMRGAQHARQFLGDTPEQSRYFDMMA